MDGRYKRQDVDEQLGVFLSTVRVTLTEKRELEPEDCEELLRWRQNAVYDGEMTALQANNSYPRSWGIVTSGDRYGVTDLRTRASAPARRENINVNVERRPIQYREPVRLSSGDSDDAYRGESQERRGRRSVLRSPEVRREEDYSREGRRSVLTTPPRRGERERSVRDYSDEGVSVWDEMSAESSSAYRSREASRSVSSSRMGRETPSRDARPMKTVLEVVAEPEPVKNETDVDGPKSVDEDLEPGDPEGIVEGTGRAFRLQSQKFLLTWTGHLDKKLVRKHLETVGKLKYCFVAHETGAKMENGERDPREKCPYNHTHAVVMYMRPVNKASKNACHTFCYIDDSIRKPVLNKAGQETSCGKVHNHIKKIQRDGQWKACVMYVCKEDKECAKEVDESDVLDGEVSMLDFFDRAISEKKSLNRAILERPMKYAGSTTGLVAAKKLYELEEEEPWDADLPKIELIHDWTRTFMDKYWSDPRVVGGARGSRTVVYLYENEYGGGKSWFADYLCQEFGEGNKYLGKTGGYVFDTFQFSQQEKIVDMKHMIAQQVERGYTLSNFILTLGKSEFLRYDMYGLLELIKDNKLDSGKYGGSMVRRLNRRLIIFANNPPKTSFWKESEKRLVESLSPDRWLILCLKEGVLTEEPWQKFQGKNRVEEIPISSIREVADHVG